MAYITRMTDGGGGKPYKKKTPSKDSGSIISEYQYEWVPGSSQPNIESGTVQYTTWTGINLTESSTDGGSSGGAVFNLNGELVGMVLNGEGELTGAIPINNIIRTLELRTK